MPKSKKIQKQIEKILDQLSQFLDQIDEVRVIQADDPDTWNSDTLYNLVVDLKATLKLLEDKVSKTEKDEFGQPLILETGLCSLEEENEEDF